ncbi:class I SAM-dependent methyltransferase [Kordiimonas marina]|uniref:class I SAM-dependent methyltransferase n=1 Tax=Kordiimonas marina TaxID=2872312 RepID=UPI001FF133BA|nr:class I SAM-dependent methyltransferase [Kordiimonas marina]MCJ9430319.1 class I SAM-dependent methyltransferase [Kordiimonas marina]
MPDHKDWNDAAYGRHAGLVVSSRDGADVIACETCGFKHIVPLPDQTKLKEFYEQAFYQSEKPDYLNRNQEDLDWRTLEFTDRFLETEAVLPEGAARRVLDIGCGPGDFLAAGKARGWDCVGVEPSPVAADFARGRGLEIITAAFDRDVAASLGQFSFVHMSEVLEHIPNPSELLSLATELLIPGGVMCVSVPNDFNPLQKAFCAESGADDWWVVPEHHLNYFDFQSLEGLIRQSGLLPFARSTNFPMEAFLLMGQDYTKAPDLGRQLHGQRKNFDMTLGRHEPEARRALYKALASAGLGRLAIILAKKG